MLDFDSRHIVMLSEVQTIPRDYYVRRQALGKHVIMTRVASRRGVSVRVADRCTDPGMGVTGLWDVSIPSPFFYREA